MSFKVQVMPEAVQEVTDIFVHHEGVATGLGERFLNALDNCFADLAVNPWREKRKADLRHALVSRFPYRVVYEVHGQQVIVYQVRHTSRQPDSRFGA